MKTRGEKTIEALTWATVVIWLGFALIMHLLDYPWLVLMVLGIILLSSAIYQRSRGWHTSLMIWIAGVWMAIFSVIEVTNEIVAALSTDGEGLQIDLLVYVGIVLISMGLAVVLRHLQPSSLIQAGASQKSARDSQDYAATYVPRRVSDDYSSGYYPPDGTVQSVPSPGQPSSGTSRARAIAEQSTTSSRARPVNPRADTSWTQNASAPARSSSRRARPAQPPTAQTPSDLESRVDDIIRRSRERRGGSTGDDLPY